jgi:hypothetical protein
MSRRSAFTSQPKYRQRLIDIEEFDVAVSPEDKARSGPKRQPIRDRRVAKRMLHDVAKLWSIQGEECLQVLDSARESFDGR